MMDTGAGMKNKLVTLIGGGGFVGRYLAQGLMRSGARVRLAQRDPRQAYFVRAQAALGQMQFASADLTRPDSIARALDGASMAVNLVGAFAGNLAAVHVTGPEELARQAERAGLEALVHISAIGADSAAASVYARTKGEGEAAVVAAFRNATVLRPSVIFGREDQFLNRFAQLIERLPVVPVLRGGARFQPVYVADVADAIVAALKDAARFGGRTLELGGPDVMTMGEIYRFLATETGRTPRFLDLPDIAGAVLARLPGAPLSVDQWLMLQSDSVVTGENGLLTLGVTPTAMAAVAPGYLVRYHKAGRFGVRAAVEA